ncbi:MAG: metallophosphatase family protein [Defluviitaleaceae bacterium]|nr:metallophosphatase family protein [Defluviitaleaceae bacterium]
MKIGIITDIHNNIYALNAVLKHFEQEQVGGIICCGDIVSIGAYPEEAVRAVMQIPNMLACVCGNHERYHTEGYNADSMGAGEKAMHEWEGGLLSQESMEFIKSLPLSQTLNILGHTIHVMHYGIIENGRYATFAKDITPDIFDEMFKDIDADIILHGHDHKAYTLQGHKCYINPGALGCPNKDRGIARAGMLHINENGFTFENISVKYDVKKTLEDFDNFDIPDKDFIKKIFYGVE